MTGRREEMGRGKVERRGGGVQYFNHADVVVMHECVDLFLHLSNRLSLLSCGHLYNNK